MRAVEHLLPFISQEFPRPSTEIIVRSNLAELYEDFNGGFFWQRALLVRPYWAVSELPLAVREWNEGMLWKDAYEGAASDIEFFAEDAFGLQFGVQDSRILQ